MGPLYGQGPPPAQAGPQGFGLFALNLLLSVTLAACVVALLVGGFFAWRLARGAGAAAPVVPAAGAADAPAA